MTFYRQVGQNIKKYRLIKNYSLQVLAEKAGVTKKTMQRYETGDIRVDMNRLGEIAVALGVKVSALIYGTDQFIEIQGEVDLVLLPVVGRISCGNGSLAYEDIEGYEPTPKSWLNGGEYFYLRAKGDSMINARIFDGDLLLIRRQPDVENGEIAAVIIGNEAVLKRVYKDKDRLVLQSENSEYHPIVTSSEEVCIVGKLKMNVVKY